MCAHISCRTICMRKPISMLSFSLNTNFNFSLTNLRFMHSKYFCYDSMSDPILPISFTLPALKSTHIPPWQTSSVSCHVSVNLWTHKIAWSKEQSLKFERMNALLEFFVWGRLRRHSELFGPKRNHFTLYAFGEMPAVSKCMAFEHKIIIDWNFLWMSLCVLCKPFIHRMKRYSHLKFEA